MEGGGRPRVVAPAPALWSEAGKHRVSLCVIIGHSVQSPGVPVSSTLAHRLTLATPTMIAGDPRVKDAYTHIEIEASADSWLQTSEYIQRLNLMNI